MIRTEDIAIFKSLFRGREDIFAIRWEKGNKSGYVPAYQFDPYHYKLHQIKGGSFNNYSEKEYLPFTDDQIIKHLTGVQQIGIYPLLKDNSSWFIAADFDKNSWVEDCRKFINECKTLNIPAYLERSRSGKGGHVWIFFEQAYPALKSRRIFIKLLEQAGIISVFDKGSSFDRLFPNQDFLSGKGFGNLIAAPLYKPALNSGNSCFINIDTLEPIADQWEFLKSIVRVKNDTLDDIERKYQKEPAYQNHHTIGKLVVRLNNSIGLNRVGIPLDLINYLKQELNFTNTEFLIKKKIWKTTFGTERYFKLIEEFDDEIKIPRGFIGKLLRYCKDKNIEYEFVDERSKIKPVPFTSKIQLRDHQKVAEDAATKKDFGVIVAPPGSGKTVIALSIIAAKQQPALIIVHRKQLAEQWMDRVESFFGISKKEIGKVSQGKIKAGKQITIALIQSLNKVLPNAVPEQLSSFGTIIVDECHHVPAETFRNTITKLKTFYLYGLTATPFRKYNDGRIIFTHLGEIIAEIKSADIENHLRTRILVRDTEFTIPFNSKTDKFETLSRILVHDTSRNKLIFGDITKELNAGKRIVVLTERKDHIDSLHQYLKQYYETVTLSGDDSVSSKNAKWKVLNEGNFQALITTGQYFGEGSDLNTIQCIFLVYPFSFEGKLVQYIGRVQRSVTEPVIYDYRDYKINYLENLFQKRNTYYKKFLTEGPLFDFYQPEEATDKSFVIETDIAIPIEQLEFRFGIIVFRHQLPETHRELIFEVANSQIRPEFEVLKPYFSKFLRSKKIKARIRVKVENDKLIYNYAASRDLDKINKEIVDGIRFKFVSDSIVRKYPTADQPNLLDVQQVQADVNSTSALYASGEELLDEILKYKYAKHHQQLRYLAQRHEGTILKIRFVLMPFSFVFLLAGTQQYHIIWETLDTEEATYIWHVDKNKTLLKTKLQQIDMELGVIRVKGRQAFLESPPQNFSRLLHDYSNEQKGYIIWRDLLEERLV